MAVGRQLQRPDGMADTAIVTMMRTTLALAAAAVCAFALDGVSAPAAAAGPEGAARPIVAAQVDPFSALVSGRREKSARAARPASGVRRYTAAAEGRVFLFETAGAEARIRFLCGPGDARIDCLIDEDSPAEEIFLLAATPTSRGDTVFRTGAGETLLRISAFGGATVLWPGETEELSVAETFSEDPPLTLAPVALDGAENRAGRATGLVSAAVGAPVMFEIGEPGLDEVNEAAVLADAIARAATALADVADDPIGARAVARRIGTVLFEAGDPPGVRLEGEALVVRYSPSRDVHGRLPSAAIVKFLEGAL